MRADFRPASVLAITALCLLGGVWNAAEAQAGMAGPMLSLRADHMILDAAAHGSKLLVATQSGRVGAFDWRGGRVEEPLLVLEAAEGQGLPPTVSSVAVSPSGQLCAAISSDGWLRVGRLGESGVLEPLFSHQRSGLLIARFLDEERLLLGDMRGELALLDLVSWREVYRRQLDYDPIDSLAVGPERRRVAVALRSSRIQILDAGRRLISAGSDAQVLVWNLEGGLQKGESGRSPP